MRAVCGSQSLHQPFCPTIGVSGNCLPGASCGLFHLETLDLAHETLVELTLLGMKINVIKLFEVLEKLSSTFHHVDYASIPQHLVIVGGSKVNLSCLSLDKYSV